MKKLNNKIVLLWLYCIISVCFLSLFIYMGVNEDVNVYNPRNIEGVTTIDNYNIDYIHDDTAPANIRKVYSWTIETSEMAEKCLRFYTSHHYVDVFIDGELVYSIHTDKDNLFGDSISSVWTNVHLYPKDEGKEIRVILTPVYDSVINYSVEFEYGTLYDMLLNELKSELMDMSLATLAIIVGVIILGYHVYAYFSKNFKKINALYLGIVSMILGVWRLMDLRFTSMLFDNFLAMGYVANGLLFLVCPPIIFHFKTDLKEKETKVLDFVLFVAIAVAIYAFGCQVFGIADLRANIYLAHIVMILTIVAVTLSIIHYKDYFIRKDFIHPTLVMVISLTVGSLLDLCLFYTTKDTVGMVFTLSAFLLHALYQFYNNIREMNYKANVDPLTGLMNKRRWESLLKSAKSDKPIGIVVIDINNLKYINDNFGHDAGDVIIYRLAHIMKSILPLHYHVCRWGGDEFAIMIEDCTQEIIDKYVKNIQTGVDTYNQLKQQQSISFAVGSAITSEFENISLNELFMIADERMLEYKKEWKLRQKS